MKLELINRHQKKPFSSLAAFKTALKDTYEKTGSARATGLLFGNVTNVTILNWLKALNIPVNGKGGPQNKGKGCAPKINAMDQKKLSNMYADEIAAKFGVTTRQIHVLKCLGHITCNYQNRRKGEARG